MILRVKVQRNDDYSIVLAFQVALQQEYFCFSPPGCLTQVFSSLRDGQNSDLEEELIISTSLVLIAKDLVIPSEHEPGAQETSGNLNPDPQRWSFLSQAHPRG